MAEERKITVGELREAIKDIPDDYAEREVSLGLSCTVHTLRHV